MATSSNTTGSSNLAVPRASTSSSSSPTSKNPTNLHIPNLPHTPQHPTPLRPPAPSLFVGPPSQNASTNSLLQHPHPCQTPSSNRVPLLRQRTFGNDLTPSNTAGGIPDPRKNSTISGEAASDGRGGSTGDAAFGINKQQAPSFTSRNQGGSTTEAIWAEMQNTLEEVELNGMSGANVFGADHARALEELRASQVELARAWARSEVEEGDDALEGFAADEGVSAGFGETATDGGRSADANAAAAGRKGEGGKSARGSFGTTTSSAGNARQTSTAGGGLGSGKTQLEEETEHDIMLARKRRLANDKYFEKVSKGVQDVVARLAVVAEKMSGVEMESSEIWGDKESVDGRGSV